jgi:hypothetical protein
MKLGLVLVFILLGCVVTPRYTNTRADVGPKPEHYEQTIREHLRIALRDPYSVQDFRVGEPELTVCTTASGHPFYLWRVLTDRHTSSS